MKWERLTKFECWKDGKQFATGGVWARGICPEGKDSQGYTTPSGVMGYNEFCWGNGSRNTGAPQCNGRGNPIHVGTGNKFQEETDYVGSGSDALVFKRFYNSAEAVNLPVITRDLSLWRHTYSRSLTFYFVPNGLRTIQVLRPDGRHFIFKDATGQRVWVGDVDEVHRLTETLDENGLTSGYIFKDMVTGDVENFDKRGRLLSIKHRSGVVEQLTYVSAGASELQSVTNSFGRTISFEYYPNGMLKKLIDPGQAEHLYEYDAQRRLISVTHPDQKTRKYLYNEPEHVYEYNPVPNGLTGIIDENGARFATWKYDGFRRAYSSEHGQGVEKTVLTFNGGNTTVTEGDRVNVVTPSSNRVRFLIAGESQPAGSGCSASAMSKQFDINNNLTKSTDFNGAITTFVYDLTRNVETSRTEGFGTQSARTISTQWHPTLRLPVKVAEPLRITSTEYFSNGLVASNTIQATSDSTGSSAFSATPVGLPRKTQFTYTEFGQVKTVTGPRTDVADVTVYEYDATGNLSSIRNAAGHVTSYSNYDLNGRVSRITAPNGLVTDLSYTPRGWLASISVGGETTSYDYDGVGQLTQTILPDGVAIFYSYDDAHRLTRIADALGNSINYSLDNWGNRITEQVKDVNGVMTRQLTRVMDGLNRVKQITGAQQ